MATATQQYIDAAAAHWDEDTLAFTTEQLRAIATTVYKRKYHPLKMANGSILPIQIEPEYQFNDTIEFEEYETLGINALIADGSGGPMVGTITRRTTYKNKLHGNKTSYGYEEINKAMKVGRPLQAQRMEATRDAYEKYVNQIAWDGDSAAGLRGVFNSRIRRGIASATIDSGSTADEILAMLGNAVTSIVDGTNQTAVPKRLVMPVPERDYLFQTYRASGSDQTIGAAFLASQRELGYIEEIIGDNNCKGKGTNGEDVMLVLPNDPSSLYLSIPQDYTVLPEEMKAMETVVHTVGQIIGAVVLKPGESAIYEGI